MSKLCLTVLQINDTHGYIDRYGEIRWNGPEPRSAFLGGFARIATLFLQARQENSEAVIALDNGDTLHGTCPAVQSKGTAPIFILDALQLDARTGHWHFAYGPKHLRELMAKLNFPLLGSNSYLKEIRVPWLERQARCYIETQCLMRRWISSYWQRSPKRQERTWHSLTDGVTALRCLPVP